MMEETKNASISINLTEGNIQITGSEEFVEKNMLSVFDFVGSKINNINPNETSKKSIKSPTTAETAISSIDEIREETSDDIFVKSGVYHIDSEDGTIAILKRIPGNSNAEKMKNIALIVLHIRKEKIIGKEIIPICEKHNCYDSSNFSAVFKNEKTNIIRKGSGQKWTIELTQPGEEAATKLLEEMANDKK